MNKPPAIIDPLKSLLKFIQELSHGYSTWQVFADFLELSALAVANRVDLRQFDKREAQYLQTIGKYKPEQKLIFPKMFECLVMALEEGFDDVLGKTFHALELHNKYSGQFFTPYEICRMISRMTIDSDVKDKIAQNGFVTMSEPACGSGAMALAAAHGMKDDGINFSTSMHVTAVDVDIKCVHMAYLQLSLLGIPAIVVHGNTLTLEEWDRFYTPVHVFDLWDYKLRRQRLKSEAAALMTEEPPIDAPLMPPTATDAGQFLMFG